MINCKKVELSGMHDLVIKFKGFQFFWIVKVQLRKIDKRAPAVIHFSITMNGNKKTSFPFLSEAETPM